MTLSLLSTIFFSLCQVTIYVSPLGDDVNSGEIDRPVQTLERAKEIASKGKGTTTIYLREGEYRLNTPLIFTEDHFNGSNLLKVSSYPQEHAIIKGSKKLNLKWTPYRDGIIHAKVEEDGGIDMLYVDGVIRHQARYPNYDEKAIRFNGTSAEATSKSRVKNWKNPSGGYLHAMHAHDWGDFHYLIIGKDKKGNLKLKGGWQNNRQLGLSEENRMVENIFEELDCPGEWYYDQTSSTLYYYPLDGENPDSVVFEVPIVKHLIELKGCSDITFENLEFTQTKRTFMEPYEPLLRSDWTIYRGGAILFEKTNNCVVQHCQLNNLGGNAIFFSDYNRNSAVKSSHIDRIGASAICFVGNPKAVRSPSFEYNDFVPFNEIDLIAGPQNDDYPAYCLVYDNLIHNIGLFEKQVAGIELSMCSNITVSHNSIYDTPRSGINVSEGTWGGHIIEFNDVFNTVKETGDHGSFNSWGRDRYWHPDRSVMDSIVEVNPSLILADVIDPIIIRNNRFRCDRGWDIDLDDGSTNYFIYNNLCLNGGIKLREGFYRVVNNNILINNTFHPHVWFKNSGDVFTHNIVMRPYAPIQVKYWGKQIDHNIFSTCEAFSDATINGTDSNSIVCAVKFKNPDSGDFRVDSSHTEIFRLGFHNFDMEHFGVLSHDLREIAETPKMPEIIFSKPSNRSNDEIVVWNGCQLKSLNTIGEQSATGMDTLRGVYVIQGIKKNQSDEVESLRANDVILKINDTDIDTVEDFLQNIPNISKPIELTILRNQNIEIISIKS